MHLSFPDDVAPSKSHCSAPNSLFRFSKFHNTNLSLIFTIQWMIHALVSTLLLSVLFTSIVLCPVELPQNICRRSKCWAIRSHRGSADNIRHLSIIRLCNCISDVLWHFEKRANAMGELQWPLDSATMSGQSENVKIVYCHNNRRFLKPELCQMIPSDCNWIWC